MRCRAGGRRATARGGPAGRRSPRSRSPRLYDLVIPAKAGIQGLETPPLALDPRFRRGEDDLSRSPVPISIGCSADRHRVDQPTLGPQIVVAALKLQRRGEAEMPVEDLAVIADRLDRVVGPFLVQPQRLAHAGGGAEHALDAVRLALGHLVVV